MRRFLATFTLALSILSCSSAVAPSTPASAPPPAPVVQRRGDPDVIVWVNTNSGVYHCPDTRWYGNTKHGRYMKQRAAQAAGYRPAYGAVCG